MRWLFHIKPVDDASKQESCQVLFDAEKGLPEEARYAPASLATEGFIHASFLADVAASARLYFPANAGLEVLQIDPRRLDVPVVFAPTPRGPMPHIHGPIPLDAIRAKLSLGDLSRTNDRVSGTRIAFIAFEGMTLLDLVGVYDPLSRIASMGFDVTASCEIVGASDGTLRAWAGDGAVLTVTRARPPLSEFDMVVVPGGPATRALVKDASLIAWLASFPANRLLSSVCTGSLLLGAAGRLRGKRATTHASAMGELAAYGANAVSERVVDEGQVVTAGGVTSGLHLGLHLVRRLEGDEVAQRIAKQMEWGEG